MLGVRLKNLLFDSNEQDEARNKEVEIVSGGDANAFMYL